MSYAKYIGGGVLIGLVVSTASCVLTRPPHYFSVIGCVFLGGLVGATIKFFKK